MPLSDSDRRSLDMIARAIDEADPEFSRRMAWPAHDIVEIPAPISGRRDASPPPKRGGLRRIAAAGWLIWVLVALLPAGLVLLIMGSELADVALIVLGSCVVFLDVAAGAIWFSIRHMKRQSRGGERS